MSLLFAPLAVGHQRLHNRLWLPAMVTWLAEADGEVNRAIQDRYTRYARGGAGMIVLEAMGVRDVSSGPLLRISHDRYIPGLKALATAIHEHGRAAGPEGVGRTLVVPQIIDFLKIARRDPTRALARLESHYPGCATWDEDRLRATLTPREWRDYACGYRQQIEDLTVEEIEHLPGYFAAAAARAQEAGFDGVELHFTHAYTLASFLSATNQRTDAYGGTLENRLRLPLAVLRAAIAAVAPPFLVGLRLTGSDDVPGGTQVDEAAWFAVELARAGAAFVSVSRGGRFEDARRPPVGHAAYPYTGPSGERCMPGPREPFGCNLTLPATIRRALRAAGLDTPVVGAGRINHVEVAEAALQRGDCDVIGMARGLLADPDWPHKIAEGKPETVNYCRYTNVCEALDQRHLPVRCQLWMKRPEGGLHPPERR